MAGNLIRNIWAVGRNYAEHAKELSNPVPDSNEAPMFFLKAGTSVEENGATLTFPESCGEIHYECEIAFQFGKDLKLTHLTLALDLTDRAMQSKLKAKGHPWTLAKSFKSSCPIGPLVKIPAGLDIQKLDFTFTVNGALRQQGNSSDMIHSVEKLRQFAISNFPVVEGDLLLTGTPSGVGALAKGDALNAKIDGLVDCSWKVLG